MSYGQEEKKQITIERYQVGTFTDKSFSGNPAAVCPLDKWVADSVLQNIAIENNITTAFYVKEGDGYRIRWFAPMEEILCGHGTLAAAYIIFNNSNLKSKSIIFYSKGGTLIATREKELISLDFPIDNLVKLEITKELKDCFKETILEIYKSNLDHVFVFGNEEQVKNCKPNFEAISKIGGRGTIITAPGNNVDFVSRYFEPEGEYEDPVTGSSHPALTKYWSSKINKDQYHAIQLSKRGGEIFCRLEEKSVKISGKAKLYSRGKIIID